MVLSFIVTHVDLHLIQMDPPQLPLAVIRKGSPRMHHTRIVRQEDISPFPREPQAHSSIIHQPIDHVHNLLIVIFDPHLTRGVLGLAFRPAFVPA